MLTPSQREIITNEVRIWMEAERMFTAFEISRAVKTKGVSLRHRDMKEHIHAAIHQRRSRNYTRSLVDVGAPQQAWLYHPLTKNPHTFTPLQRSDGPVSGQPASSAPSSQGSPKFHSRNLVPLVDRDSPLPVATDGTYGCDNEGNLTIPALEMQKLGVAENDMVHIVSDPVKNELILGKPGDVDSDGADIESTTGEGNLFIAHEMLEFVDLDWLAGYKVALVDGTIHVTESRD